MEMPKPTEDHARLAALAGEWRGEEILHPSPWSPERRTATGRFSCRIGMDGMFLVTDYEESRDGAVFFRGHGVYGYDATRGKYTMFWFDSLGMSPTEALGDFDGDTLAFENAGANGRARYVYELTGPDRFTFRILTSPDGATWAPTEGSPRNRDLTDRDH